MSVALENLSGVDSVKVSLQKGTADIQLDADNRITIAQIRRAIRTSGYPTKDAQIVARGKIATAGGRRVLDLLNGSTLPIDEGAGQPGDAIVALTGVSRMGKGKDEERLTITSIK